MHICISQNVVISEAVTVTDYSHRQTISYDREICLNAYALMTDSTAIPDKVLVVRCQMGDRILHKVYYAVF